MDETGEEDDMDYEPSTEGESEDMPDISQQLLEAVEEGGYGGGHDQFHGVMKHSPDKFVALTFQ
jgi:hypothetical protein